MTPTSTCLLHIGLDLAGTSQIREALRQLPADGPWTLEAGEEDPGQALAAAFSDHPQSLPHLRRMDWLPEEFVEHAQGLREEIDAEIRSHPGRDLIISSQSIGNLNDVELRRLKDFLEARFAKIRVLAFVAPPGTTMASAFCERLKVSKQLIDLGRTWPGYRQRLEKFEIVFGPNQLELKQFQPGDPDVFHALGLTPPASPTRTELLTMEAAALLFAYRKYGGQHDRGRKDRQRDRALLQEFRGLGTTPFAFSPDFISAARQRKADDVRWLEERLGAPLADAIALTGIRDAADLLTRSVAAADLLKSKNPELTSPPPRTAREAAQVVHEFANSQFPPADGEEAPSAFAPNANASDRENLLQADRLTMKSGPVCYIHIGMAKTGTTSIQDTLRKAERSTEYGYLKAGPANHSRMMVALFKEKPERFPFFRKSGWSLEQVHAYIAEMKAELEAELAANAHRTFVISGESIITMRPAELTAMRDFIRRYFREIRIVAYLRAPKSYMESIFQQRLKGGSFQTDFASAYPDYIKKIRKFDEVFGADRVILRKFDPALFPRRDVVLDFCQLLGITLRDYEALKTNESLSLEAIALLFAYRKFGGKFGAGEAVVERNNKMIKTLRLIRGRKFGFSSATTTAIIDSQRQDLEWLEGRAGFSLGSVSSNDPPDAIGTPAELLELSMSGAAKLIEVAGGKFTPSIANPQRPRGAARVLHDYLVTLDPTLEGTFPEKKAKPAKPDDKKPLLRRVKNWLRGPNS